MDLNTPKMTWEEIKKAFPDRHVLLVEMEYHGPYGNLSAGRVIAHGQTRRELVAEPWPEGGHFAARWTGKTELPISVRPWVG